MIIATYHRQSPGAERARCEASARGAMFWTGRLDLGQPVYWVTLPVAIADPLQILRVISAVDAALGVRRPR